jgi:hypothetical protein
MTKCFSCPLDSHKKTRPATSARRGRLASVPGFKTSSTSKSQGRPSVALGEQRFGATLISPHLPGRADDTGAEVQAGATVVDNMTGGSALFLSFFSGENRLWLVGVASLEGVNNSQWRTDMWLHNPTEDWLAGELEFMVGDSPTDVYGVHVPTLCAHRAKKAWTSSAMYSVLKRPVATSC